MLTRLCDIWNRPIYYKGNPSTLIGREQEVPWPNYTHLMDYELKLGLVLGKSGRNLTLDFEQALLDNYSILVLSDF